MNPFEMKDKNLIPLTVLDTVIRRERRGGNLVEITHVPLHEVDAEDLADLCHRFRAEIFEKAGKLDPDYPDGLDDPDDPLKA